MKNISIHLEGLDLTGKTTVTRILTEKTHAIVRRNSLMADNPLHSRAEILRKNDVLAPSLLGWIYLGTLTYEMLKYQQPDSMLIQDSTIILRSIAYHRSLGNNELADAFDALLPDYPRFTASFILHASDEVRLKRLEGRISRHNDNPEDYIIRTNPELFHKMEQTLTDYAVKYFNATIIDTSFLEQEGQKEAVADKILRLAGYNSTLDSAC